MKHIKDNDKNILLQHFQTQFGVDSSKIEFFAFNRNGYAPVTIDAGAKDKLLYYAYYTKENRINIITKEQYEELISSQTQEHENQPHDNGEYITEYEKLLYAVEEIVAEKEKIIYDLICENEKLEKTIKKMSDEIAQKNKLNDDTIRELRKKISNKYKKTVTIEQVNKIKQLISEGKSENEIVSMADTSKGTIWRVKKGYYDKM